MKDSSLFFALEFEGLAEDPSALGFILPTLLYSRHARPQWFPKYEEAGERCWGAKSVMVDSQNVP